MSKPVAVFRDREADHPFGMPPQLEKLFTPHFTVKTLKEVQAENMLDQVQVIFVNPADFSAYIPLLPQLSQLKVLATISAGYNHMINFPAEELKNRDIKMTYCPGVLNASVADMATALMLAAARNVVPGAKLAMGDKMPQFSSSDYGQEVSGATLGIVGMGGIGLDVAKRAYNGFGMKILYYNRSRRSTGDEEIVRAEYCPTLAEMLPRCDFVVITCALSPQTENLISAAEFKLMKSTASIVNVARGQIIDQDALLTALNENWIRSAALDVTVPEPLPRDHPLLKCQNCLVVPHYGSATLATRSAMCQVTIDDALAVLRGKPQKNQLIL